MTSLPVRITVNCPGCPNVFEMQYRPSVALVVEEWSAEQIEQVTTAT